MIGKQLHTTECLEVLDLIRPVENDERSLLIRKPRAGTGLWTSTWQEETNDSAWVEWCRWNDYGSPYKHNWFLLTPRADAHLYVVDSIRDLHRLLHNYELKTALSEQYRMLGQSIDFEKLARGYDGMYLTEKGNAETHLSFPENLNSWDCESTVWFKWCFTEVQRIAVPTLIGID